MSESNPRRSRGQSLVAMVAVTGAGAAIALTTVPVAAVAATAAHQRTSAHQHHTARHHHAQRLHIVGLVASHHRHSMTVFARTATAGTRTRHNQRLHISFAPNIHANTHVPIGDVVRINAVGQLHQNHVLIVRHNSESVSTAAATLLFGTVTAINGNELLVSEHARDNGGSQDGNNSQDGGGQGGSSGSDGGSQGGSGSDSVLRASDSQSDGDSHSIIVDDSAATVIVDNGANPLAVGDTVAILGEVTDNTVIAEAIFGFSTTPSFLRGEVVSVSGSSVTVATGDGTDMSQDIQPADDNGQDVNTTQTFDLSDVPLALNGTSASASDLAPSDKIILLGPANPETGQVVPTVAFAFNGNDNGPVGDNQGGDS